VAVAGHTSVRVGSLAQEPLAALVAAIKPTTANNATAAARKLEAELYRTADAAHKVCLDVSFI
jgi:hypothetical protein